MLELCIQNELNLPNIPQDHQLSDWVNKALQKNYAQIEQLIRIVNQDEIKMLNKQYRNKDCSTNILSFPAEQYDFLDYDCLGDLVVCADVVAKEAKEQNKNLNDHWAHLIIHGMLHLQGFDHIEENEAVTMEALEIKILETMGVSNPYNDDMTMNTKAE